MVVYRGMDVGTAKPDAAERAGVPHHLIDVADPAEPFSVAGIQRLAADALADVGARGRQALLVGGSAACTTGPSSTGWSSPGPSRERARCWRRRPRPRGRTRSTAACAEWTPRPRPGSSPPTCAGPSGRWRSPPSPGGRSRASPTPGSRYPRGHVRAAGVDVPRPLLHAPDRAPRRRDDARACSRRRGHCSMPASAGSSPPRRPSATLEAAACLGGEIG